MVQKGYQVQYLEPTKTFLYTKENLSITITEYIPLIQINAAAYFFKTSPIIGHMGVQLEKEDALRFQKWVDVHETNTNRFIPKTIPPQKKRAAKQPPVSLIPNKKKYFKKNSAYKLHKIIIDAGHGGKDGGAKAYGYKEKDMTLLITKELARSLKKAGTKAKIILTRKRNRYVSLEKRCHIANRALKQHENGLFISIHLNAWFHEETRGFETYYLAHSSKVTDARVLSHIEDTTVDLSNTNWKGKNPYSVIFSRLEIVQYQRESKFIAESITRSVQKHVRLYPVNRGVKSDLFYVLKGTLMPAILIEVGFLSNKKDVEFLTHPKKRSLLTDSIAQGVIHYEKTLQNTRNFSKDLFWDEQPP